MYGLAKKVFFHDAAVRENRFWVLTHPELKPAIEAHTQEVMEERTPSAAFFG